MSTNNPTILILQSESTFKDLNAGLFGSLRPHFNLLTAKNKQSFLQHLQSTTIHAILITDASITSPPNDTILPHLIQFTKQGGTLIFCAQFSSFIRPLEFPKLITQFGLPWLFGDYVRDHQTLSKRSVLGASGLFSLVDGYSMKAQYLENVTVEEAVYASLRDETSIAFAQVFQSGYVGYIGDVNNEIGTSGALLAMCQFKDFASASVTWTGEKHYVGQDSLIVPEPVKYSRYDYDEDTCSNCSMEADFGMKLRKCSGCLVTRYCDVGCQKEHWKEWHKNECKAFQEERAGR